MINVLWFTAGMLFVYIFHMFSMRNRYRKEIIRAVLRNIAKNHVPIADVGRMADKIDEFNAGELDEELRKRIYNNLQSLAMKNAEQVDDEVAFYEDVIETLSSGL